MSQWTIQIDQTSDGRYQWRHVPAEGTGPGTAHASDEHYATADAARAAGEQALARHHETALGGSAAQDAPPETPAHDPHTRLGESQAQLEAQEDPRLQGQSPVSLSSLPIEAEIRTADEQASALARP